jgi:hypothetical protein
MCERGLEKTQLLRLIALDNKVGGSQLEWREKELARELP